MNIEILDHGPIREIRLARPPVNALDTALCRALTQAIEQAPGTGAQAIVLSGGERIFSAGLDVPHLLAHREDRARLLESWAAFFEAARALAHCAVPVVAAMGGHAPAGGCVLALCCDYRIMAHSPDPTRAYMIGLNEVQVGLVAPEAIQRLLRRAVGARVAERLLVAGELVPAERAAQIGLVDELTDGTQVVARALAWLQALLALPRAPMLATRAIARAELIEALQPQRIDLPHFVDRWYHGDTQRALQALVERLKK